MTDIFLERRQTRLSFVVRLVDDYTGTNPIGNVNVSLKDRNEKPIRNLSLFYVFVDIHPDIYTVHVESDYYLDEYGYINTNLSGFNPEKPFEIRLKPKPSYPFPAGATLVRGMLWDSNDLEKRKVRPDTDISGNCSGINIKLDTKTTEKGEFVFYFGLDVIQKTKINNESMDISDGSFGEDCAIIECQTMKLDVPEPII